MSVPINIRYLPNRTSYNKKSIKEAIAHIQERTENMVCFWSKAHGWAPKEASTLLSSVRLDYFASLAKCLSLSILTPVKPEQEPGRLILAWAHLGSLLECTLQLFLGVYLGDYLKDENRVIDRRKPKISKPLLPHELTLEYLRVFFDKSIWDDSDKSQWSKWILNIQQKRNAIHALKPRPLGTWPDLKLAVKQYNSFLEYLDGRIPYPDR